MRVNYGNFHTVHIAAQILREINSLDRVSKSTIKRDHDYYGEIKNIFRQINVFLLKIKNLLKN